MAPQPTVQHQPRAAATRSQLLLLRAVATTGRDDRRNRPTERLNLTLKTITTYEEPAFGASGVRGQNKNDSYLTDTDVFTNPSRCAFGKPT